MVELVAAMTGASVLLVAASARRAHMSRALRRLGAAPPPPRAAHSTVPLLLAAIGRASVARRARQDPVLLRRLELAGGSWPVEVVAGAKVALGAAATIPLTPVAISVPSSIAALVAIAVVSYRIPDVLLSRIAVRRQRAIDRTVPELVDVLLAMAGGGGTPLLGLARAAPTLPGPLGTELRAALGQVELGAPWQAALRDLSTRTDAPSVRRLVTTLTRSQRLGAPVMDSLTVLAEDLRAEHRARAEESARRAPVKMLFPLVFLILPAFLLLTVGPVLVATLRSLD